MQPRRFGKYLLLDRLSTGGMAEVYLAKGPAESGRERLVAIKRILPVVAEDPDFQTMFIDEARISTRLDHDNIGRVYEFGQVDQEYFIAMEYIAGLDLRRIRTALVERHQRMPLSVALFICAQVCRGLDYAHRLTDEHGRSMEIVHRDVSPPNVLVGFDGRITLIDFGIARATSRVTRTRAGKLKGKFSYMSPEQVEGKSLDHRSDIFTCGTLLYEMLTHRRPFSGDHQMAVLHAIRKANAPPPSSVDPDVPLQVDRIVMKALSRDRERRYAWATEMSEAIEAYLERVDGAFGPAPVKVWMADAFAAELARERKLERRARAVAISQFPAAGDSFFDAPDGADEEDRPTGHYEGPTRASRAEAGPAPISGQITDENELTFAEQLDDATVAEARPPAAAAHPGGVVADDVGALEPGTLGTEALPTTDAWHRSAAASAEEEKTEISAPPLAATELRSSRRPRPARDAAGRAPGPAVALDARSVRARSPLEDLPLRDLDPHAGRAGGDTDRTEAPPPVLSDSAEAALAEPDRARVDELDGPLLADDEDADTIDQLLDDTDEEDLPTCVDSPSARLRRQAALAAEDPDSRAAEVGPRPGAAGDPPGGKRRRLRTWALPRVSLGWTRRFKLLWQRIPFDWVRQPKKLFRRPKKLLQRLNATQVMLVAGGLTLMLLSMLLFLLLSGGPPPEQARGTGAVMITTSRPASCAVSLDERPRGLLAPGGSLTLNEIVAGEHSIVLRCHGFPPYRTKTSVKPDQVTLLDAALRKR